MMNDRLMSHSDMKYKAGDVVYLRDDLINLRIYGGWNYVESILGCFIEQPLIITGVENKSNSTKKYYHIKEVSDCYLTDEMIDHNKTARMKENRRKGDGNMKYNVGDKVKLKMLEDGTRYGSLTYLWEDIAMTGEYIEILTIDPSDRTYQIKGDEGSFWISEEMVEGSKEELEELPSVPKWFDDWVKTFSDTDNGKSKALRNLSRTGWGYDLTDNNGKEVVPSFNKDSVSSIAECMGGNITKGTLFLANALLNGYKVEEKEQLYYIDVEVENENTFLNYRKDDSTYHFMDNTETKVFQTKFTEEEIKEINPKYWYFRVPVEELEGED